MKSEKGKHVRWISVDPVEYDTDRFDERDEYYLHHYDDEDGEEISIALGSFLICLVVCATILGMSIYGGVKLVCSLLAKD